MADDQDKQKKSAGDKVFDDSLEAFARDLADDGDEPAESKESQIASSDFTLMRMQALEKPPLEEELIEPNESATDACACNSVCSCVPVGTCACFDVCQCDSVSTCASFSSGGGGGCTPIIIIT